jgi:hypothetical protein
LDAIKEWNPPKFKCKEYDTTIWSRYPGEYVSCSCGKIAVDYTHHYGRHIGFPENFIEVVKDD